MADNQRSDEEREMSAWRSGVDLDAMGDDEIMELIADALDRLSPTRLSQVIEAVQTRRRAKEEEVKNALLTEFRERALQAGVSLESLFGGGRRTRSDAGQPLTPKYRGPGGETWSGRGRQPNWLTALEATGRDKEEFRIKEETAESAA
jgi:DNA-binding protein H-NS